jgi:hypothetical protein
MSKKAVKKSLESPKTDPNVLFKAIFKRFLDSQVQNGLKKYTFI